jgi:hypothetical protein
MDEAKWSACTNPFPMLESLSGKGSDRKMRLFAVACCSLLRAVHTDSRLRHALETAAQAADGLVKPGALRGVQRRLAQTANAVLRRELTSAVLASLESQASIAARLAAEEVLGVVMSTYPVNEWYERSNEVRTTQRQFLLDIFGNPFRPVTLNLAHLTPTVVAVAQAAYTDRAFDQLPILADALEDAGCTDAAILDHLRGPGPHVRGCFALDLILAKDR